MPEDPNDTSWLNEIEGDLGAEKAENDARRTALREEEERALANAPEVACARCGRKEKVPPHLAEIIGETHLLCARCGRKAMREAARRGHLRGPF